MTTTSVPPVDEEQLGAFLQQFVSGLLGGGGGAGCADLDLPSEVGGASGPHAGDGLVAVGWVS